jgi:hypothetical protein
MYHEQIDRTWGRKFRHPRRVFSESTMAAKTTTAPFSLRARMREAEMTARNLIARAAYIEKRAKRAGVDSVERTSLDARARMLRADADLLLTEISELSRHLTRRSAA